jgi:Putative polyhydroxyalkanoic acid system protein (PHA_gran_rgn)
MAALKMSVKHNQTFEAARANFVNGITRAQEKYGSHIGRIEWSPDQTAATLSGTGFEVRLSVDPESVHATGHVPFFFKLFEGQVRKFVQETLASP